MIKITSTGIWGISLLSGNDITSDMSVSVAASRMSSTVINVYDAGGKILLHKEFHLNNDNNILKLDTQTLAAGVYFIGLQTADGGEQVIKFLKR